MTEILGNDLLCMLCGKSLSNGEPTNKEHYTPQTMIKKFDLLQIPSRFSWALRINQYGLSAANEIKEERVLVPVAKHYDWATVRTHTKCNQDASVMCRHMSDIIRNLDRKPTKEQSDSITAYYAHIWGVDAATTHLATDGGRPTGDQMLLYRPGLLSAGRFVVWTEATVANDFEKHTIYLGERQAFDQAFKCGACGLRTSILTDGCTKCNSCGYYTG